MKDDFPAVTAPLTSAHYRYERKFSIPALTPQAVEAIVKVNPANFSEIYSERFVNNIYFDSINLKSYFDRIDGVNDSLKIRIRWYGRLFGYIETPVLELKIKNGPLGKKNVFLLKGFLFDNDFNLAKNHNVFRESDLPDVLKTNLASLEFSLLSRFKRKYFLSADHDFRITIDSDIAYYKLKNHHNTFLHKIPGGSGAVLELKYDQNKEDAAGGITNFLPFRVTKNSKYVKGVEILNSW